LHREAGFAQRFGGAAGGNDFNAGLRQDLGKRNEAGLVGNGEQRAMNFHARQNPRNPPPPQPLNGIHPADFVHHHQTALQPISVLGGMVLFACTILCPFCRGWNLKLASEMSLVMRAAILAKKIAYPTLRPRLVSNCNGRANPSDATKSTLAARRTARAASANRFGSEDNSDQT